MKLFLLCTSVNMIPLFNSMNFALFIPHTIDRPSNSSSAIFSLFEKTQKPFSNSVVISSILLRNHSSKDPTGVSSANIRNPFSASLKCWSVRQSVMTPGFC